MRRSVPLGLRCLVLCSVGLGQLYAIRVKRVVHVLPCLTDAAVGEHLNSTAYRQSLVWLIILYLLVLLTRSKRDCALF